VGGFDTIYRVVWCVCVRYGRLLYHVYFGNLLVYRIGFFGILSFQPKIFRLKWLISKVSNPIAWPFMFQRHFGQKYFV